ncbi:coagulation factor XIII B chain isoform X4 [Thamnophis elegans]|uniref:coagulation factor XIII B chain isoform X4 n=1 Tax=Thamnophis elegans TaxID=35005 RepID=UPI001376A189|nr:coagulation factor XIII B chain isoform X4 [Thamnophis elegans]
MEYKRWMFSFLLMFAAIRKLLAEDKACDFPNIENGRIALYYYSFKNYYFPMKKGEKLSYTCLAGYSTETGSQNGRVNCTNEGWIPVPKCHKKCVQPTLDNGIFSDTKLSYNIWENLRYSCHSGYQTAEGEVDANIQCLQDGWSVQPLCMGAIKEPLGTCLAPDLLHGHYHTVQRVFNVNDKLKYECRDGYVTAGGDAIEEVLCQIQGWSLVPKCTKLACSSPNPVEHGKVHPKQSSYEEGDVIQIICLEGYTLRGPELIQCYYFGWYPEFPICEERRNKCPPPPQPPNTRLLTNLRTYRQGDIIHYQCERSFQLNGTGEIRCENGKWTSPPKCIVVGRVLTTEDYWAVETGENCNPPPVVKNSITVNDIGQLASYNPGSSVEYGCRPLHVMKGSNTVHCIHGAWTEPPTCLGLRANCGPPPSIENGAVMGSLTENYEDGSTIQYNCNEYHVLQGSITVFCSRSQWTTPPVCIEPCTLSQEEMAKNNLLLRWSFDNRPYFLHGEFVEFVCKAYHTKRLSNLPSDFRVQCQNGQLLYPQCIRNKW